MMKYCKRHRIKARKSKRGDWYCPQCLPSGKGIIDMRRFYSDDLVDELP